MMRLTVGIACVAFLAMALEPAMGQSDWTEIAHDSGVNVTFYYSPGSVQRNGGLSTAKWHDSNHSELVYLAQVNCAEQTIQSLSVDVYDQNGNFQQTVDLSSQGTPQQIGPAGTFGANLAQAIC